MGQKVSPNGLRIGINKGWNSLWYVGKADFAKNLKEDNVIRKFIKEKYFACAISKIIIERTAKRVIVNVYTARPGVLIGQKGAGVETLKKEGNFTTEAQQKAFTMTKNAVLNILSAEAKEVLTEAFGDLNTYVNKQIEASVNVNKITVEK